jgi:hypothetical protein
MPELVGGGIVVLSIVPVTLAALAVAYLALRFRDAREEIADPELGIKSAYHAFLTAGILLALTGLSLSVIDLLSEAFDENPHRPQQQVPFNPNFPGQPAPRPARIDDSPFDRVSQRVALPLVVSGVLFSLLSLVLIRLGTNDPHYPAARRTFGGVRLAVAGLSVMVAGTLAIEVLFRKDNGLATTRPYAVAIGLLIVWLPTAAIQLFVLKRYAKLPYYVPPKPKKRKWRDEEEADDEEPRPRRRRDEAEEAPRREPPEDPRPAKRRPPERRRDNDEEGERDRG